MSAEFVQPEIPDANVHELTPRFISEIADRAHIEQELLRGARVERLEPDDRVTIDMHDLKDIDGNGLVMIFGLGKQSALKLYRKTDGEGYRLTSGDHSSKDVDDPIVPLNYTDIRRGRSYIHGRETKYRNVLGIAEDPRVSRKQMIIEISDEDQMTLTDNHSTNGLLAIMQEVEKPELGEVVREKVWKRLFGRQVVVDGRIQHK